MKALKCLSLFLISGYLVGSCKCSDLGPPEPFHIYVFYRNGNGADLLDAKTTSHYIVDDITVNGFHAGTHYDFKITNSPSLPNPYGTNLPDGYACDIAIEPFYSGKQMLIVLDKNDMDTLFPVFTGNKLTGCRYNNIDVLPPNLAYMVFPAIIKK